MLNYANLNDVEFEYLCQDIMQKKLGVALKRFAPGRDGGIDLRPAVGGTDIVIQVKHYTNSSVSSLMSVLKAEASKVKKLQPKQYILCCSCTLSPAKVTEIRNLFSPYMATEKNVITLCEIEDFLQDPQNRDVLEKHYKLWIESTGILEHLTSRDVFLDCEYLLSDIHESISCFVRTSAFDAALECLSHCRTLFIIGDPGTGKTLTSMMLVCHFAAQGYRVRFTSESSNLSALKKALSDDPGAKEIILLDDCFGQAYFQMKDTQSTELLALIKHVNIFKNKYLILNSRVTIYQEARKQKPELITSFDHREYKTFVLNMSNISPLEKAKILYNHLVFSGIPHEYYCQIRKDRRYREIVQHKNYNPRIIEFITCPSRLSAVSPEAYYQFVMDNLNDPRNIWRDEFENKLQQADRIFLLTLFSLTNTAADLNTLKACFNYWLQNEKEIDLTIDQFEASFARLQEGFVKIVDKNGIRQISTANPSVNDFLSAVVSNNEPLKRRIMENACALDQFAKMLSQEGFEEFTKDALQSGKARSLLFRSNDQKNAFFATYLAKYHILDEGHTDIVHAYLRKPAMLFIGFQAMLSKEMILRNLLIPEFISFYQLKNAITANELQLVFEEQTFGEVVDTVCALSPLFTDKEREPFLLSAVDALNASIESLCDGVDADDYSCDVVSAIRRATDYGYESEYAEVDEDYAVQLVEDDIESTVNADILQGILSLPEDLQAIIPVEEHYKVTVDGADALVQQYLDEDDYEVEFEEVGEQLDEIDTIFANP